MKCTVKGIERSHDTSSRFAEKVTKAGLTEYILLKLTVSK